MKKLLFIISLLVTSNLSCQYEILVDEYSTDQYTYPFIREGIKIQFLLNNEPSALVVSKYNFETGEFDPVEAFYITEWYNNYNKDGYNWFFLRGDTFGEYSINYNPKTKKATFGDKYSRYNQKFTFISGETTIKNKISSLSKEFFNEKNKIDKEIGEELSNLLEQGDIKKLTNYKRKISDKVFSIELKNNYLSIIDNKILEHNDSLLNLFQTSLKNKNLDVLKSSFDNLIEYNKLDELREEIISEFNLNKIISMDRDEKFLNAVVRNISFRNTKDNNFRKKLKPIKLKYKKGQIVFFHKTSIDDGYQQIIDGGIYARDLSKDLKKELEKIDLLSEQFDLQLNPRFKPVEIELILTLKPTKTIFIHGKKDDLTIFVDNNKLKNSQLNIFEGGNFTEEEQLFFKKKSSNNLIPINTKSYKSVRDVLKSNRRNTYFFSVNSNRKIKTTKFDFEGYYGENGFLNGQLTRNNTGTYYPFFTNKKKLITAYTQWVYELYVNGFKIKDMDWERKFPQENKVSIPFKFNAPFYTVDLFQVF